MNHNEYIESMFGETSCTAGEDLGTVACAVVATYAQRMYPESAEALAVDTRQNQMIASEIAASLLMRNGGNYGAAAADMPRAVSRALRLIEDSPETFDTTDQGQQALRALLRAI